MSFVSFEVLSGVAYCGDLSALRELVRRDASLNITASHGSTLLEDAVMNLCYDHLAFRYGVVRELISLGADPNLLGPEGTGPLLPAIIAMPSSITDSQFMICGFRKSPPKAIEATRILGCASSTGWHRNMVADVPTISSSCASRVRSLRPNSRIALPTDLSRHG